MSLRKRKKVREEVQSYREKLVRKKNAIGEKRSREEEKISYTVDKETKSYRER